METTSLVRRAPQWVRRRAGRLAAATVALLLVVPATGANAVFNPNNETLPGRYQFVATESGPVEPYRPETGHLWAPLEFDQRAMTFGEVASYSLNLATNDLGTGQPCGAVRFTVTRYQNYRLAWETSAGNLTILYRGGLVADRNRPYVGVFYGAGNRLEIRTYNRLTAYDRFGIPIPGAVSNAWTAASVTAPTNVLSVEKNGLWSVDRAGTKRPWRTGKTTC